MNGAESVSNKEMESVVYLISHSNDSESDNPPPTPPHKCGLSGLCTKVYWKAISLKIFFLP